MSTDTLDIDSPVVYELGDMVIQPYDYQWKAVKAALREFETVNSTLIVMPTGSGKTETALFKARVVIEEGGRVLFLAHTDELVSQPVAKAIPIGMTAVREKAGDHACPHFTRGEGASLWGEVGDPKLVVGSVQTLQGKRLKSWPKGHFDLIIRDEAHHAYSPSDRAIVDHFEPKWYLGMTATPDRGDGNPIVGKGQPFETLAYEYSMTSAVEEGFLARPMFQCLDTEIDLSSLRPNRKDYNAEDLAEVLQPHIEELVSELVPKLEGRRAIIFVPMVCTAQAVASAFQSLVVAAEWISGESENRSDIIEDFKAGRHQHLVNAMVLTEGFDARFVDTVVILRATKSRALFVQMAGRCLRTYPGKQEGLILGVRWKTFKHKLVHPTQIFDTTRGPVANEQVLEEVAALVDEGKASDLLDAIKQGEEIVRQKELIKLKVQQRKAKAKSYKFDPLSFDPDTLAQSFANQPTNHDARFFKQPTEKQTAILLKNGFKPQDIERWTMTQASAMISKIMERRNKGLATLKQVNILRRYGIRAENMTMTQATNHIDAIASNNWKPLRSTAQPA